jgi:hypothetical protein
MRYAWIAGLAASLAWTPVGHAVAVTPLPNGHDLDLRKGSWHRVTDREGSSISVPTSFVVDKSEGDAIIFRSKDRRMTVRFWTMTESRAGFPGHNPAGDMDLQRSDCDTWPPEYYVVTKSRAAYSCVRDGKVTYYVAKYGPSGGVAVFVTYPKNEKQRWDRLITRMASSLRQVSRKTSQ